MKKLKNGCHFFNIDCTEKFPIVDPPKVWVYSFPIVNRDRISESAIVKKLKNGCHFFNIDCTEKFPITNLPKFGSPVFQVSKNGCHFFNIDRMENFSITDPPQSLGLQFSECQQKRNIRVSHYETIEKWLPFL